MLLKRNLKSILVLVGCLMAFSGFAVNLYTVKSGDSLWKIATNNKPQKSISTYNMIKAIKGMNEESSPNIIENIVRNGQQLNIPSTLQEVRDAIKLFSASQNQYTQTTNQTNGQNQQPVVTSSAAPTTSQSDSVKSSSSGSSMQQSVQLQSLIQAKQQLSSELQNLQNSTNEKISQFENDKISLEKAIANLKNDNNLTVAWVIIVILLIILAIFLLNRRRLVKDLNKLRSDRKFNQAKSDEPNYDNTEPSLFGHESDLNTGVNVNEALVEAMVMFYEGNVQDAKLCLQNALNYQPENVEIRMKLLEVYGVEDDLVSFNSERDYLSSHLIPHDDERWGEIEQLFNRYFINDKADINTETQT